MLHRPVELARVTGHVRFRALRLGARSIAVLPATHAAVMRACAAACCRAACAVITHSTDPMATALQLQPANCQHTCEYYCSEKFLHRYSPTENRRFSRHGNHMSITLQHQFETQTVVPTRKWICRTPDKSRNRGFEVALHFSD